MGKSLVQTCGKTRECIGGGKKIARVIESVRTRRGYSPGSYI